MGNLLEWFDDDEVILIGEQILFRSKRFERPLRQRIYRVPTSPYAQDRLFRWLRIPLLVLLGLWVVQRFDCQAIVTVFSDETFLFSGYCIHRLTGLPFIPYFHDLYLENRTTPSLRRFAEWLQPRVFGRATELVVLNPSMAEYYHQRYGLKATVLSHCINHEIPREVEIPHPSIPMRIGFIGKISYHNDDALRNLIAAVGDCPDYELIFYSATELNYLKLAGIWASNVRLRFARDPASLLEALRKCDVLIMPFCFDCEGISEDEIATAFSTKMLDYLAVGRPILIHCPDHYYTARFARQRGCGLVVDSLDPIALVQALELLKRDADLRDKLVTNALSVADEMRGEKVSARFREIITRATQ
jgi:glycosyltransferase involved in cell wall biosynthesis